MADLNTAVLKEFGYNIHKVKKEKAYYICETSDGLKKIVKTSDTADNILFQHAIKENLWAKGYFGVDRYILSVTGQPFVEASGENFIMTPFIKGRETDFENWVDVEQAVMAVARFHVYSRQVPLKEIHKTGTDLQIFFEKQLSELNTIIKRVRKQPRLSDFDVLFIKNAHYYIGQIQNAISGLRQTQYIPWRERSLSHRHICHNGLKEESVILTDKKTFITQWNAAAVDVQLNDINSLICRYVQRSGTQAVPIARFLDSYCRVEPLPSSGMAILYMLLRFPWHFMKIVNQYYSKRRSWTPNAIANRMLTVVSEKEHFDRYIQDLEKHL